MADNKSCAKCGEVKSYEAFSRKAKASDGRQPWCKKCAHAHRLQWAKGNPEKVRVYRLWDNYKIRESDWNRMYEEQGGLCASCKIAEARVVDHDHSCCPQGRACCGKCVRGLLCDNCNLALGALKDSKDRILGLVDYLERDRTVRR